MRRASRSRNVPSLVAPLGEISIARFGLPTALESSLLGDFEHEVWTPESRRRREIGSSQKRRRLGIGSGASSARGEISGSGGWNADERGSCGLVLLASLLSCGVLLCGRIRKTGPDVVQALGVLDETVVGRRPRPPSHESMNPKCGRVVRARLLIVPSSALGA